MKCLLASSTFINSKLGPHLIQLHRKILRLQGKLKDLPQIADALVPAKRENGDFLPGIIRRGEKGETLHVIPMKMSEHDDELVFLLVADGAHVPAEIANPVPASIIWIRPVSGNVI